MRELIRRYHGVLSTRVGCMGGTNSNATYRNHDGHPEAIEIILDPAGVSYRQLLEFFFQIHDPSTHNRQGNDIGASYHSAIFYTSSEQNRLRLEGGANVLAAAQAAGLRRYLRQSIAFWAIPGRGLADEATPLAFDASPYVAADARLITELEDRLLEHPNMEAIALRYGFFYGPSGSRS